MRQATKCEAKRSPLGAQSLNKPCQRPKEKNRSSDCPDRIQHITHPRAVFSLSKRSLWEAADLSILRAISTSRTSRFLSFVISRTPFDTSMSPLLSRARDYNCLRRGKQKPGHFDKRYRASFYTS